MHRKFLLFSFIPKKDGEKEEEKQTMKTETMLGSTFDPEPEDFRLSE